MRLAILDDYQNVALAVTDWTVVRERADITVFNDHVADLDALAERLKPFDAVVVMRERTPFPSALFERLPRLRLLVTTGMRNASIDLAAARERGVTVCGTASLGAPPAELTWGLILALARNIPQEDRATREGRWQTSLGMALQGKTLGVIGLGRIGSQVAAVGKAFGMNVVAWSQNLTEERCREVGVARLAKEELLAAADVVTLHLALGARTLGVIGRAELARMKATAYLVNTARGPLVDGDALVAALDAGTIAGAGLDVFSVEPLPPDHALRHHPRTVITPHLGYVTDDNYRLFYGQCVEDILAYLEGRPIRVL